MVLAGIVYWHGTEQKRWSEWRLHKLYMIDLVQEKIDAGCSEDSIIIYSKQIDDSLYIEPPTDCLYCTIKKKIISMAVVWE